MGSMRSMSFIHLTLLRGSAHNAATFA
jgi:hypothetical protein